MPTEHRRARLWVGYFFKINQFRYVLACLGLIPFTFSFRDNHQPRNAFCRLIILISFFLLTKTRVTTIVMCNLNLLIILFVAASFFPGPHSPACSIAGVVFLYACRLPAYFFHKMPFAGVFSPKEFQRPACFISKMPPHIVFLGFFF